VFLAVFVVSRGDVVVAPGSSQGDSLAPPLASSEIPDTLVTSGAVAIVASRNEVLDRVASALAVGDEVVGLPPSSPFRPVVEGELLSAIVAHAPRPGEYLLADGLGDVPGARLVKVAIELVIRGEILASSPGLGVASAGGGTTHGAGSKYLLRRG